MSYIDVKYIGLVSPQLQKFSKKKDFLYNFRCPYCGDSKKHQNKTRGYIFKVKNDFVFKCHNCGVGRTFTNFLKDNCAHLHNQYVMERYREGLTGKNTQTKTPDFKFTKPEFKKRKTGIELDKISELNITHPARVYLEERKIKELDYFYYCPKFKEWTNFQVDVFPNLKQDGPRIIIPLRDKEGNMFGYQGRSMAPKAKIRYITIMLDDSKTKIFGMDRVDENEIIYVTEGPFDSMFLSNSIAMCGSDVNIGSNNYQLVYVFDNEPRNKEIVQKYIKTIDAGERVVIWPTGIVEKDINDMVMSGHDVQNVVQSNTYQGLEAKLKLTEWKKV
jgi:transcription elongation factor Elf1